MILRRSEIKRIEDKIKSIEQTSELEIVPCILKESDQYLVSHYRAGIIFITIVYAISFYFSLGPYLRFYFFGSFFLGALLCYLPAFKKFFIYRTEKEEEVGQRAKELFYELNIHHTEKSNGVLIFISVLEKKVQIIADYGISKEIDTQYWDNLKSSMLLQIKSGRVVDAIVEGMSKIEKDFGAKFPKGSNYKSQIDDHFLTNLKISEF